MGTIIPFPARPLPLIIGSDAEAELTEICHIHDAMCALANDQSVPDPPPHVRSLAPPPSRAPANDRTSARMWALSNLAPVRRHHATLVAGIYSFVAVQDELQDEIPFQRHLAIGFFIPKIETEALMFGYRSADGFQCWKILALDGDGEPLPLLRSFSTK